MILTRDKPEALGDSVNAKPHAVPRSHQASCWLYSKLTQGHLPWAGRGREMIGQLGCEKIQSVQGVECLESRNEGWVSLSCMLEVLGSILRTI